MDEQKKHRSKDRSRSITEAFIKHETFLKRFISRFLSRPQDIEDVVQETYLKAYAAEKVTDISHPKAYLFSIAKNIALGELTKKSSQITGYIEECKQELAIPSTPTAESELEAEQSLGLYCEAIATLPEKCRRVFLLRKVHGLKQKEIAQTLGISVRMVEKHLHLGTQKCSDYMNDMGEPHKTERMNEPSTPHQNIPKEGLDL